MPLRTAAILVGLFFACVAIVLLAWATGSELYLCLPSRRCGFSKPPTDPTVILVSFAFCLALSLYSQRYALWLFTGLLGGLALGIAAGYAVYAWTPSIMQIVLTAAMSVETCYAWSIQKEYLSE